MIPDGVYLGLSNEAYHEDHALGGGDHKGLLTNAVQWHGRERNPVWREINPPSDEESAAQRFGSALHCMVLEPDEFDARYCLEPERPEGIPRTKAEINDALARMGRPTLRDAAKKDDYIVAAKIAGIMLLEDWEQDAALVAAGRERISAKWELALRMLHRTIERHSKASQFVTHGRAEVSVFWTDESGTRLKVRFDYLRIRTVCDVKTYSQRDGLHPVEAFGAARDRFAYDLQAAHYMDARMNALPRLVADGRVYDARKRDDGVWEVPADAEDQEFFRKVAAFEDPSWWWLACSTMGIPEVDTIEFPRSLMAFSSAQSQVQIARDKYREMRGIFGDDDRNMWVEDRGLIRLTDFSFRSNATNRGATTYEAADG